MLLKLISGGESVEEERAESEDFQQGVRQKLFIKH